MTGTRDVIYITKWATTRGIIVTEAQVWEPTHGRLPRASPQLPGLRCNPILILNRDFFLTKERAREDVVSRFRRAVKRAQKELSRVEAASLKLAEVALHDVTKGRNKGRSIKTLGVFY